MITARLLLLQLVVFPAFIKTARANAQSILDKKINVTVEQTEVKKLLQEIKKQTGIDFTYSSDVINVKEKVSCKLVNKKLSDFLESVLKPLGISFSIIEDKQILLFKSAGEDPPKKNETQGSPETYYAAPPPVKIRGQVTNDKSLPMAGVTVIIRGTGNSVVTDGDGRYSINAPYAEATIVFSFVGYLSQEIPLQGRTEISVVLKEDAQNLKDVVVVGYGTQKKVTVTGAVSAISSKVLQQSPTASLTNALAGRLPGLNVNQFSGGEPGVDLSDLYIRGVGTYGNTKPIVIVDGVERSLNYLSADEIESFTILKDASATAVFGVRGANGVIVITTKRGKASEKASVNFKISNGVNKPIRLPKYLGSADYATLYNEAKLNDAPAGTDPATLGLFSPKAIENFKKAKGDNSDGLGYNIDYLDYAFKAGYQQDYTLSIQGGSNNARYYIMGNYFQQNGNYKHTVNDAYNTQAIFKRYNFRSNVDVDITKYFYARLDLGARVTDRNAPGTTAARIMEIGNTQPPYYPIKVENNDNPANKQYFANFPDGLLFGTRLNRFNMLGETTKTGFLDQRDNYLEGTFFLGYKLDALTKGLKVEASFSYDRQGGYWISRTVPTETQGYRVYPGYATFFPSDGEDVYKAGGHYTGGYSSPERSTDNTIGNSYSNDDNIGRSYYQVKIDYARSFGKHNVSGLILGNRSIRIKNSEVPFTYQGLSGRVTYNYDQRYLAEFDVGYNGSENFAKGKRYGTFPAVSAGWVISNEKFMQSTQSWLGLLKIRGSYGLVGNDQLGPDPSQNRFGYLQFFNGSNGYNFGLQNNNNPGGLYPGALANPDLTWEKARKVNLGIDMEFLNRRLTFTLDLFHEHRYDILTNPNNPDIQHFPSLVGAQAPLLNLGIVNNKGFDLEISWSDKIGKYFLYSISPNVSFARNKIIYEREISRQHSWQYRTGHSVGQPFVYVFDGFIANQAEADKLNAMNNGTGFQKFGTVHPGDVKYKDIDGDGQITDLNDRVPMGYPRIPEIQFGVPMTFSYKSFDLSVLFQGALHTSMQLGGPATYDFPLYENDQIGKVKPMHLQRWTPATASIAKYPALHYGANDNNKNPNSSLFLYNARYLRLKNFEIGYNLPQKWMKKLGLQRARVYVQGLNVLTFDGLKDIDVDPEINRFNGDWYPIMKVYNFGVTVNL